MPKKQSPSLPAFEISEAEVEVAWAALSAVVRQNAAAVQQMSPDQWKVAKNLFDRMTTHLMPPDPPRTARKR